ncbi:hypothetical protein C8R45DRAFT_1068030 [Mycena sanguinolenta]|nr:hypothetical protein C8R45DRAFT_1068030 [Mycena sanguinolenta]
MRKKDRRNHNPRLKWTSSHANRQYLPFFWVLTYLALSLVAFGLSPNIHSTIKLLAAEIGTHIGTVTAAFSQEVPTTDGYPHTLVTLCDKSYELFDKLRANQLPLYCAVEELTKMAKSKDSDTAPAPSAALCGRKWSLNSDVQGSAQARKPSRAGPGLEQAGPSPAQGFGGLRARARGMPGPPCPASPGPDIYIQLVHGRS